MMMKLKRKGSFQSRNKVKTEQKNISKTVKAKEEKYVWVCTLRILYALLTNGFWNLLKNIYNK